MDEKYEKLTADDIDIDTLEARLELVKPGLDNGYYCYGDG